MDLKIKSTAGLHALLASRIVQCSSKYDAKIEIIYEDKTVDAKSILGLVSLAVPKGDNIKIVAAGPEAELAINDLRKIIE